MSEVLITTPVAAPAAAPATPAAGSRAGAFPTPRARRRYRTVVAVLALASAGFALGLLAWDNPMPVGSHGFWRIADRRVLSPSEFDVLSARLFGSVTNAQGVVPIIIGLVGGSVFLCVVLRKGRL